MISINRVGLWRVLRAMAGITLLSFIIGCGGGDGPIVESPKVKAADVLGLTGPVAGGAKLSCGLRKSDAIAIEIASNFAPGYWWDHTNLTISVEAQPNSEPAIVDAIHDAIATWSQLLHDCFKGRITLTNITDTQNSQLRDADIIVHYVPHAGGNVWNGFTVCGDHECNNVLVKSEYPLPMGVEIPPFAIGYVAQHEIGHALGLGHATNLWESHDLMGYGWAVEQKAPIVSRCDFETLGFVFAWTFEGGEPHPPGAGPYEC